MADPKKNPCKGFSFLEDLRVVLVAQCAKDNMNTPAIAPSLHRLRRHGSELDHECYADTGGGGRGPPGPAGDRGKPGKPGAAGKQGKPGKGKK